MQKTMVSFLLAAALTVGGAAAGYAAASREPQSVVKEAAVNRVTAPTEFGGAAVQVKADKEAVIQKRADDIAEAQKKAEDAEAKKKAEAEAKKKAEEEAAKQAEAEAVAAAQNDAAADSYAAPAASNYAAPAAVNNVVQSVPAETVYTEPVYQQPLCPYGHALVNGNMCGYQDCPNGYCYSGNNSYGGDCVNYDYSGGQHHQYGHGSGHHGH